MTNQFDPTEPLTKKVEVKCYMTMVYCRHCGAPLHRSNTVLSSYPEQYQYFCNRCGLDSITSTVQYPKISYEEVETNNDENISNT